MRSRLFRQELPASMQMRASASSQNTLTVRNSPSHINHSALPLRPASSWLRECYSTELSREVQVVKCLQVKRELFSCTVPSDKIPQALACRKVLVAVGLRSRGIIICDAITGIYTPVPSGHMDHMEPLPFRRMAHSMHREVTAKPSTSGTSRLVGSSGPFLATPSGFAPFPFYRAIS